MFLNSLVCLRMENRLEGRRGTASSSRRESKSLCRLIIRAYGLTRARVRETSTLQFFAAWLVLSQGTVPIQNFPVRIFFYVFVLFVSAKVGNNSPKRRESTNLLPAPIYSNFRGYIAMRPVQDNAYIYYTVLNMSMHYPINMIMHTFI